MGCNIICFRFLSIDWLNTGYRISFLTYSVKVLVIGLGDYIFITEK